jgi:hypothetical protein
VVCFGSVDVVLSVFCFCREGPGGFVSSGGVSGRGEVGEGREDGPEPTFTPPRKMGWNLRLLLFEKEARGEGDVLDCHVVGG